MGEKSTSMGEPFDELIQILVHLKGVSENQSNCLSHYLFIWKNAIGAAPWS